MNDSPHRIATVEADGMNMERRSFLSLLFAGMGSFMYSPSCSRPPSKPNVLLIFIDDMGYGDPGCYGNELVSTPHIDRLANEGIRFTQFYVNSPICSPSRVALTTGTYPARWRINSYLNSRRRNRERGMADYLDPVAPTIARCFREAGYATAHFGKWHMGGGRDVGDAPLPSAYGFDESLVSFEGLGDRILPPGSLSDMSEQLGRGNISRVKKHEMTGIYVDRVIDFIRRNRNRPFYVHLFPNDVHDGHHPQPELMKKYQAFSDNPYQQKFFAVLDELDRQVGRVLDALDQLGLSQNTIVVFTSDNGPTDWPKYYREGYPPPGSTGPLRGRKWSLYEGGIRVPFICRWPGQVPAGVVNNHSVICALDLFPTLCRLADVKLPSNYRPDGEVMADAFLGGEQKRSKPIFWEYGRDESYLKPGHPAFVSPNLAMRQGRWKLLVNDDGTRPELYDLESDIGEQHNLAAVEKTIAVKMKRQLLEWRKSLP